MWLFVAKLVGGYLLAAPLAASVIGWLIYAHGDGLDEPGPRRSYLASMLRRS